MAGRCISAGPTKLGRQALRPFSKLTLLENLTIAENLYLGREPRRYGMISRVDMRTNSRAVLDEIGLHFNVDQRCGDLTVGEQHLVEIAKSAVLKSRIVIYDEPTAALDIPGVAKLLALIERQKAEGKLVFYISHRLEEIFRICDTVTVLKDGVHMAPVRRQPRANRSFG